MLILNIFRVENLVFVGNWEMLWTTALKMKAQSESSYSQRLINLKPINSEGNLIRWHYHQIYIFYTFAYKQLAKTFRLISQNIYWFNF